MSRDAATEELLRQAADPDATPFEYIIVGSGAGGGPLAARLALNGRRVLLIEAGIDPAGDGKEPRPVYSVPSFHAAASEDAEITWDFSVRHFADDALQRQDPKYDRLKDPSANGGTGKGGIQYPRCAALGGCTSHHSMIVIRPNDSDWERIADHTGDESWRAERMQGYFPKIERCSYYSEYTDFFSKIFGGVLHLLQWIATLVSPMRQLDTGGHGFAGWQPTSFVDPVFVASLARSDRTFRRVLFDVAWAALKGKDALKQVGRILSPFQLIQFLDPNLRSQIFPQRDHLCLISIGTQGGRRFGLREHLRSVEEEFPDRLVIASETHVTRVLFAPAQEGAEPRAIGVEAYEGRHLYRASPMAGAPRAAAVKYFAKHEVILCGGAFNTPQLLMLSGIGDRQHLEAHGIRGPRGVEGGDPVADIVHLPAVGRHLQDRYEISVVSEMEHDFSMLRGVSFIPGQAGDPAFAQWRKHKTGLYTTNGTSLALMYSSDAERSEPDVVVVGVPAAFRGYYRNWSRELLRKKAGDADEQRNLWTWLILQAYTKSHAGTVRLLSGDPFAPPEINFHSFFEGSAASGHDLDVLCKAVQKVRGINREISAYKSEVEPGDKDGQALRDWIQARAWGHHACGTCRMGGDTDPDAVVDSKFRVRGVQGLRVVDASVFPEIPGYFLATSIFMMSEKAADTLLADSPQYPNAMRQAEAQAVRDRRKAAGVPAHGDPAALPGDAIGVALSGGGVRSATFALGVLQALASCRQLRHVDFLSAVSGGGYIGAFLGRLFTRLGEGVKDKVERVEQVLTSLRSAELWWLRRNANYISGAGRTDLASSIAVVARNLASLYVCVGSLLLALFGGLRWAAEAPSAWSVAGIAISAWWWVPAALLVLLVLPLGFAFWLTPAGDADREYAAPPIVLWCVLLACAAAALSFPGGAAWGAAAILGLASAWLCQECARRVVKSENPDVGATGVPVRNRLTLWLGSALGITVALAAVVVLDTLARRAAEQVMSGVGWGMLATGALLPLVRIGAILLANAMAKAASTSHARLFDLLGLLSIALLVLLVFFVDVVAHGAFRDHAVGVWLTVSALAVAFVLGQALRFPNLSSLAPFYTEKLVRTFLGASNEARVHASGAAAAPRVDVARAGDDIFFDKYSPEQSGGPLHLVGACVNETVDFQSGRQLQQDYGLPLCAGPAGISVGRRFHALWDKDNATGTSIPIRPLPVEADPNAFHAFARSHRPSSRVEQLRQKVRALWTGVAVDKARIYVERLRLGQWMAISGAAFTTGSGRSTSLTRSVLCGLLNIRLGYWWDSGVNAWERPGRFPPGLWRRIIALPATFFRAQATLLNELRGYFTGPSARYWYLSDGGHFDNTGIYELLRRRLPLMVAIDGTEDESYRHEDLAILTRQARLDFGAEFLWLDPAAARACGPGGWRAIDAGNPQVSVPGWIRRHFNPDAICALSELRRESSRCAALARVSYADDPAAESWLLLIKPALPPEAALDVRHYGATHAAFPNESTLNQFFGDAQWESYRMLGWSAGRNVFAEMPK